MNFTHTFNNKLIRTLFITAVIILFIAAVLAFSQTATALAAGGTPRYVDGATGADGSDCSDPANPCATIGYGTSQAVDGDSVLIAEGTYMENVTYDSKGLTVRGGYTISGSTWISQSGQTIVDGGGLDRVFFVHSGDSVFEDLYVTNGRAPAMEPWGGGIWITNGFFEIRRTMVFSNVNGGIEVNSDFGPAYLLLDKSIIADNNTMSAGLNVSETEASADVVNSLITGNSGAAGGVRLGSGNMDAGSLTMFNSTVADNAGSAGIEVEDGGAFSMTNSIVWGNAGPALGCTGTCAVDYSDVEGGWAGTGNIDSDPLFINAAGGDYHLMAASPAIDAGTAVGAPPDDLDGNLRDGSPDMGAYEYFGPTSVWLSEFGRDGGDFGVFWLVILLVAVGGWLFRRRIRLEI